NENLPWQQRDHALFIAFAPVAAPQYAVCVVVEHGGGGSAVAGPIVHDIMLETQPRNPARTNRAQQLALTGEPSGGRNPWRPCSGRSFRSPRSCSRSPGA